MNDEIMRSLVTQLEGDAEQIFQMRSELEEAGQSVEKLVTFADNAPVIASILEAIAKEIQEVGRIIHQKA